MRNEIQQVLWLPHYWGRVDGEAVLLLQVPNYQVLTDLQAIAGRIPSNPRLTMVFNRNTGETEEQLGWLYIGDKSGIPADAKQVWVANYGSEEVVVIGSGEAPAGAVPYVYRFLKGINYE